MLTCFDVANYFLALVDEDAGDAMTNLKLQKLAYYAQGVCLALYDRQIFGEKILAWQHGPVVRELYDEYCGFGRNPIPSLEEGIDLTKYSAEDLDTLDEVNAVYGQYSATKLRNMTHEEAPWKETAMNCEITVAKLRDFFKTQLISDGKG